MPIKKNQKIKYIQTVGKRKSAVALIRIYNIDKNKKITINNILLKQGDIVVNKKHLIDAFPFEVHRKIITKPLFLTNSEEKFIISINLYGGGYKGRAEAISHGIAKALVLIDSEKYKSILKKNKLLTRDPRVKERRKVGTGGKARRKKQSPKR